MFHYVDPNDEIKQKKRIVKQLIKVNKNDRGLGLTKPEAIKVNDLLKACEDIETQGAIVLKSVSQSLLRDKAITQEPINRFYTIIRKGILVLSQSTFKQTPRTDIQNLIDYRDSINKIKIALEETFNLLHEESFGNEPLKGRTPAEYQAQTGRPYRPPVSAKALSDSINKTISKEQLQARYVSGLLRLNDALNEYEARLAGIESRIEQTQDLKDAKEANIDRYRTQLINLYRDYDTKSPAEQVNITARGNAIGANFDREQRQIDDIDVALDDLEQEKRILPTTIQNIKTQIERLQDLIDSLPAGNTQPLSEEEYANQLAYEKQGQVVNADFSLVMNELNKFLSSLTDGLIRYESGLSTSLSKSQVTNYRTPTEQAETKLGSGRDLTKGIHKRFL
jgi:predicted  nucleic acid-binding Zn-ribbon protein